MAGRRRRRSPRRRRLGAPLSESTGMGGDTGAMASATSTSSGDLHIGTVLVPLDGSEFALRAMPTARVLADRFGAALHTISVAERDDEVRRLQALSAAVLGVDVGNDRAVVVRERDPAEAIA